MFPWHLSTDYDVGHSIRTCIIPEAVLWYTGEAMEDDEDEEGDYDDEVGPEQCCTTHLVMLTLLLCIVRCDSMWNVTVGECSALLH